MQLEQRIRQGQQNRLERTMELEQQMKEWGLLQIFPWRPTLGQQRQVRWIQQGRQIQQERRIQQGRRIQQEPRTR